MEEVHLVPFTDAFGDDLITIITTLRFLVSRPVHRDLSHGEDRSFFLNRGQSPDSGTPPKHSVKN